MFTRPAPAPLGAVEEAEAAQGERLALLEGGEVEGN